MQWFRLLDRIKARRADRAFQKRLRASIEAHQEALDRLAGDAHRETQQ